MKKELRKMNRRELLEVLLQQTKEIELLEKRLAEANAELEARRLTSTETGNLAEEALKLSGVFEAAQQAADLYLENVRRQYPASEEGHE